MIEKMHPLKMLMLLAIELASLWSSSSMAAQNFRALLIGVSEYPNLEKELQLSGPANDVSSFYQMLVERGTRADRIHVVADNTAIPDARQPTKREILKSFDDIEKSLRSDPTDDAFVFVLMAGHGSQMPAALGDNVEADSLDEIFLPRDVGKWDGEVGALPNAISDNELGAAVSRLRATGAFVWAVFDNCHAGSITRGATIMGERNRNVPPAALGVPADVMAQAVRRAQGMHTRGGLTVESMIDAPDAGKEKGGFVAFYASQSYETTPEYLLPQFASDAAQRGLFSYTLQQVLNVAPKASYRQVAEHIMQRYRALGRSSPTPAVEGSELDAAVFGAQINAAVRQWPIEAKGSGILMRAGQLHEITDGSILALVPEATSEDAKTFGYVEVVRAGTTQSSVRPIAYKNQAVFDASKISGANAYARPVELKVDFSLRVAEPAISEVCDAPTPALNLVIQQLKGRSDIARRVHWVASGEAAQIRLCARKNQVFFLDASAGNGDKQAVSMELKPEDVEAKPDALSTGAKALGGTLERIGRATNLVRLVISGAASNPLLEFNLGYERCAAGKAICPYDRQPINPLTATSLRDGDKVYVTVSNTSYSPANFAVLYVDANYGISVLYPAEDESSRIEPRAHASFDFNIGAEPLGHENLIFVAVPADPQIPDVRFDSLAQQGLSVAQSRETRSGPKSAFMELLEDAAFGEARGIIRRGQLPTQLVAPQVYFYEWNVLK